MPRGRPKKLKPKIEIQSKLQEVLKLLKARMPACFDREPQSMNSGVDKLAADITNLFK